MLDQLRSATASGCELSSLGGGHLNARKLPALVYSSLNSSY
ncbi:hypothetical protein C4K09_1082 [Pseudomonas chlororaphis subsp. aureofaciens]|nr:hypothetical protein C4K09_1082 [Pseudomonas chlororaphis subsp. aureofaciens]